jgi:hypothetical protein
MKELSEKLLSAIEAAEPRLREISALESDQACVARRLVA